VPVGGPPAPSSIPPPHRSTRRKAEVKSLGRGSRLGGRRARRSLAPRPSTGRCRPCHLPSASSPTPNWSAWITPRAGRRRLPGCVLPAPAPNAKVILEQHQLGVGGSRSARSGRRRPCAGRRDCVKHLQAGPAGQGCRPGPRAFSDSAGGRVALLFPGRRVSAWASAIFCCASATDFLRHRQRGHRGPLRRGTRAGRPTPSRRPTPCRGRPGVPVGWRLSRPGDGEVVGLDLPGHLADAVHEPLVLDVEIADLHGGLVGGFEFRLGPCRSAGGNLSASSEMAVLTPGSAGPRRKAPPRPARAAEARNDHVFTEEVRGALHREVSP